MGLFKKMVAGAIAGGVFGAKTKNPLVAAPVGYAVGALTTYREIKEEMGSGNASVGRQEMDAAGYGHARDFDMLGAKEDAIGMLDSQLKETIVQKFRENASIEALPYANEYMDRHPEDAYGYYAAACALRREKDVRDLAIRLSRIAISLCDNIPTLMYYGNVLGELLYLEGRYKEAFDTYKVWHDWYSKGNGEDSADDMMLGYVLSVRRIGYPPEVTRRNLQDQMVAYMSRNSNHADFLTDLLIEIANDVSPEESAFA